MISFIVILLGVVIVIVRKRKIGGAMKLYRINFILPVIISLFTSIAFSATQSGAESGKDSHKFWQKQSITAEITNVDKKKNEVTVKGPEGRDVTFNVNKNVDLSNVKKGDSIRADYYRSVVMDVNKPTPEQERQKYSVLESQKIAPAGIDIAGGSLRQIKAVVNIKKVDTTAQEVVITGPNGKEYTLSVPDKKMFDNLKEGQNAIVTYTEAIATKLEKTK